MKVVTLKDIPNTPMEGAERIEGYTGPVSRSRQTIIQPGDSANYNCSVVNFSQGCTTGWHTHPGILLLSLAADSGPVDWYDAACGKRVYNAGDSWTEGTKLHDVVNNSSIDAHFLVTYVVAKGVGKRTDQPAPACAAALGLL